VLVPVVGGRLAGPQLVTVVERLGLAVGDEADLDRITGGLVLRAEQPGDVELLGALGAAGRRATGVVVAAARGRGQQQHGQRHPDQSPPGQRAGPPRS
jgi:hypothetical protein